MEKVESPKWRILQMSRAGVFQPGISKHSSVFTGYMKVDAYEKIQQVVALHRFQSRINENGNGTSSSICSSRYSFASAYRPSSAR